MKYRPITRQRLSKHIPTGANARNSRTSIAGMENRRRCFPLDPPQGYKTVGSRGAVSYQKLREFSWRRFDLKDSLPRIGSISGDGSRRWLTRNIKKGIRLWKENFMCDLKWQGDC
jgi:hypothetical protein